MRFFTFGGERVRKTQQEYRCEAASIEGFVQQLSVSYAANGYYFYSCGFIPDRFDPRDVDRKLIEKYQLNISKYVRFRRKQNMRSNLQYIRHDRFFVLIATEPYGNHHFFREEHDIKDIRETPIKYAGYAVSFRGGHACVRIEKQTYLDLKAYMVEHALWSKAKLESAIRSLPFEGYVPVFLQLIRIVNSVNNRRVRAGYEPLSTSCVQSHRTIYRPFEHVKTSSNDRESPLDRAS